MPKPHFAAPFLVETGGETMKTEPLSDTIFACFDKHASYGVDAFLLARFSNPQANEHALDLCAGCGIVSLLWARDGNCQNITALELLPNAAELARESIRLSKLEDRVSLLCADLRDYETLFHPSCYDLIAVNPPFYQTNAGTISPIPERALARSDQAATLDDICKAAAYLLKPEGRLKICIRPERADELKTLLYAHQITPTRQQSVRHNPEKSPFLVLIEAKKSAGELSEIPDFLLYQNGTPTAEYLNLYEKK